MPFILMLLEMRNGKYTILKLTKESLKDMKIDTYIKLKSFFKQMFFLLFPIFVFSIFLIGIPTLTNNYSIEEITIEYAELQVTGKHSDPGLRIVEGRKILSGDCHISLGDLCNKYHYKSVFGKNNKIIIIDEKKSIIIYSEITDGNGNDFLINNIKHKDNIIKKFIQRQKSIVYALAFLCIFSLVGFFSVHFFIKLKENSWKYY